MIFLHVLDIFQNNDKKKFHLWSAVHSLRNASLKEDIPWPLQSNDYSYNIVEIIITFSKTILLGRNSSNMSRYL